MSHLFSIPQGAPPIPPGSAPRTSSPPMPKHSPRPKSGASLSRPNGCLTSQWDHLSQETPKGPSTLKQWQEIMPLHKALTRSCQEAFSQDSSLVNEMREEYFQSHHPNFNHENTHDLTEVFWCIWSKLQIYLAQPSLRSQKHGQGKMNYDRLNYSLMTLQKGLKFFRAVSPLESPKVKGLMGIHDPDMLHHFNGVTHCPWCGKVGQNKGTIINHLGTVHYKLGLVCKKCFGCPSEAILLHHGWKSCLPSGEGGQDESSSSA